MNKLNKIFLGIIIILVIALSIITMLYLKQRDLIYEYFGNYEFTLSEDNQNNNTELNNEIKQIDFYYPMQKSKNRSKNTVKRVIDNYSFLCYYDFKDKQRYI